MKKTFFLALFFLTLTAVAQEECSLCGMWTVTRRIMLDEDNSTDKIFIKINIHGERYSVKVKEFYTYDNGSTKTYYWHECNSVCVVGNTISWESLSHVLGEEDFDDNDKINGQRIYSAKYYYVCEATEENGSLHFRYTVRGDLFGVKGNVVGHRWNRNINGETSWQEYEMYKDDPDW